MFTDSLTDTGRRELTNMLSNWLRAIDWQSAIPGICFLCDLPCRGNRDLCPACAQTLPWADAIAFKPPPRLASVEQLRAPFVYEGAIADWIGRFKFQQSLAHGRLLGQLLAEHVAMTAQQERRDYPDYLVPVPLHWRRLHRRGFNQARLLATALRRRLHIPLCETKLRRRRHRPPQHQLTERERSTNLRGAFTSKPWAGEYIVLVDDVVTSGATATEIAQTCLRAGAARVDLWCVGRKP